MSGSLLNRNKSVGLILTLGSLIALLVSVGWVVFTNQKYWPTPHYDQLMRRLNADLNAADFTATDFKIGTHDSALSNKRIDKVKVYKSKRVLELSSHGQVVQRYPIRLGFEPIGNKLTEGDGKTPEGMYTLDWRNPNSQFYKSLHVSYPNQQDQANATMQGLKAGSNIMIHGSFPIQGKLTRSGKPFYHYMPQQDWTLGCIAVSNAAMDDIWTRVKNGTLIEIVP